MPLNYHKARAILEAVFAEIEASRAHGEDPQLMDSASAQACKTAFESKTQAYREALLGCVLARFQDKTIDVRLPYVNQGDNAFNGRTLDGEAINPFLSDHQIPSTKGPYLSVFRRNVQFRLETRSGLKDKKGYDAMLNCISQVENLATDAELSMYLRCLLDRFYTLREEAAIRLARIQRISLDQYGTLLTELLATPSGGRFPVMFTVASFRTIKEAFSLDWEIVAQGINVSDAASSAGGDITIRSGGETLLAVEVTERPVDRARVVTTFNTKISPNAIQDYLFMVKPGAAETDAKAQAHQYFAQGHEVNFIEIGSWILALLGTVGKRGREIFGRTLLELLDGTDTPKALKVAWNSRVNALLAS